MSIAIKAEGLGKYYHIIHEQQARYATLRDTLAEKFLNIGRSRAQVQEEDFWALSDVNLEIQQGERVGIIGRNGAGKSTLLKLLSRITEPSKGRIYLRGRVASLLEVGTGFHPELSGRENIYLNGAVLGMNRSEIGRKFDEIVAFAEVERFLDTPVKRYSSGMYTRLAFAVASHLDADVLMVDEVLAVGDAVFQKRCLNRMQNISNEGRTVLLVSHRMSAIERLCERVLVLNGGYVENDTRDVRQGLNSYLATTEGDNAWSWCLGDDAKFNDDTLPLAMYLTDASGGRIQRVIANDERVDVNIEIELRTTDPALNIGYAIYNSDGQLLYWSTHMDSSQAEWPSLKMGKNHLLVSLPSRLLNEGDYHLELMVSLHYRKWIYQPGRNAPRIHLTIRGGLSDSPVWIERRPGVIAPVLPWRMERQGPGS